MIITVNFEWIHSKLTFPIIKSADKGLAAENQEIHSSIDNFNMDWLKPVL